MKGTIISLLFLFTGQLLQADESLPTPRPPDDTSIWQMVTMFAIAAFFFYFIIYRPEQKRRMAMEAQRNGLKKGDQVTAMGIIGTVAKVGENSVVLRMIDGSKIEMLKSAINEIIPSGAEETT